MAEKLLVDPLEKEDDVGKFRWDEAVEQVFVSICVLLWFTTHPFFSI
jgi:hypothetical protein